MENFEYGLNSDGYIYGRLFKSGFNNGSYVIDIGEKEFNVNGFNIEVWNGKQYISTTANDNINKRFYGGYARLKQQMLIIK